MKASNLNSEEYNSYYAPYLDLVSNQDLVVSLQEGLEETLSFYESIPEDKWMFAYSQGKWTIKEIVQHLLDTERVFAYRALCFLEEIL